VKAVAHRDRIRAAMEWVDGKSDVLPPPVTLTVDPTNLCNVNCQWCKTNDFRSQNGTSINDKRLLEIPDFLAEWKVPAVVLSGGEPLLHPKIVPFLQALKKNGIQVGLKTNGVRLGSPEVRAAVLESCSWVGFSLDAATAETYLRAKRANPQAFQKIIENVKWLAENRNGAGKPRLTMKFLIHHSTFRDGYAFCDLAKQVGADEVMIRPVFLKNYSFSRGVKRTAQFFLREARLAFEDEKFKIYGLVSKMEREWDRAIRFKKCYASVLGGVLAADGKFYVCSDRRGDMEVAVRDWYPFDEFLSFWGSDEHREVVRAVQPQGCPKCSLSGVNEIAEECMPGDEMMLDFL